MSKGKRRWPWVLAAVVIVGSCGNIVGRDNDDADTSTGSSLQQSTAGEFSDARTSASPEPAAPVEAECHSDDTVYDGEGTCHPGGELVTVTSVLDGNTLDVGDGRTVRLLGVQVADLGSCAGPGARDYTRALVEGRQVKLHAEPGVDRNGAGHLLRYVEYSETPDRDGLPIFAQDLGGHVVLAGWGLPAEGQINPEYLDRLDSAAGIAEYRPEGRYAPPCGTPLVYGDDDGNGVADWEEDSDSSYYVDAPDVDLPDGALTGGYCARRWWC